MTCTTPPSRCSGGSDQQAVRSLRKAEDKTSGEAIAHSNGKSRNDSGTRCETISSRGWLGSRLMLREVPASPSDAQLIELPGQVEEPRFR